MKQTVNLYDFRRAFESMRPDDFSYEGLEVLFESFEQLADDTGTEVELDVIGICCEFSEGTIDEIIDNYDIDTSISGNLSGNKQSPVAMELKEQAVLEYLRYHSYVAGQTSNGSIVYQDF
jgi:hypothetical protein